MPLFIDRLPFDCWTDATRSPPLSYWTIMHMVTLKPFPLVPTLCPDWDVVLGRRVSWLDAATVRKHYGAAVYAVAKRLLGKRELRQLPVPMGTSP